MNDMDFDSYLTVGKSEEQVEEREYKKLEKEVNLLYDVWVTEIKEVNGHEIKITQINKKE